MKQQIKVIGFDADDTLWENEPYFEEIELKFCVLMENYLSHQSISQEIFRNQIKNLPLYGYGIKGYVLSMVETAAEISGGNLPIEAIQKIIAYGKELLSKPVILMDGVKETLEKLNGDYKLIVVTKGDLLDQHRKLHNSGLGTLFHHIEVVSEKNDEDYRKLLQRLEINPAEFYMIGNSLKSDILPVLNIGGYATHIPFRTTWEHERIDFEIKHENFRSVEHIADILKWF
ncbi:MAG TPA: HAD family hydrolase [Flavobacterium sp.]|nr:HAD family hydrolase [Flavobacterium sp.]